MTPTSEKLAELILYVAQRSESDKRFGKTKLNKILFYSDFGAFQRFGRSITGEEYAKYPFGPVSPSVQPLLDYLQRTGALFIDVVAAGDHEQQQPRALRAPNLTLFSAAEKQLVDDVIQRLWRHTGAQVSDLSHDFIGWQIVDLGEVIPYETTLMHNSPMTEAEEKYAQSLIDSGRACTTS
jgi:hypothetical protein